jgi:hypothetical protein
MTISKAARIKDWTREGVFYLTVRYQHVLWAAELPFVAAAIEEDAEAKDSLELVRAAAAGAGTAMLRHGRSALVLASKGLCM